MPEGGEGFHSLSKANLSAGGLDVRITAIALVTALTFGAVREKAQ